MELVVGSESNADFDTCCNITLKQTDYAGIAKIYLNCRKMGIKEETFKRILANHVIAADALSRGDMVKTDFMDAIRHLSSNTIFLVSNCCGDEYLNKVENIMEKYLGSEKNDC